MAVSRETIMQALFAKISASPAFLTSQRTVLLSGDLGNLPQPAVIQWEHDERYQDTVRSQPQKREPTVYWVIYAQGAAGVPFATVINPLLDAVDAALAPDDFTCGACTLGGLVTWCRISGTVAKETGDTVPGNGYQGCAVVPIKILVP